MSEQKTAKRKTGTKTQKEELPGVVPPMDTAAKLAIELDEADKEIESAYLNREALEGRLIEALESTGRRRITVGDLFYEIREVPGKKKISKRRNKTTKTETV